MPATSEVWEPILEPYRARDWHDCIEQVRRQVDADPFALLPRLLLAALYLKAENQRLAQLHYEKLLPVTVGKGDLFRAIAVQRHLDQLDPQNRAPGRFAAMHRWFRMVGLRQASNGPELEGLITPATLLGLSDDRFEDLAEGLELEHLDLAPREVELEGGTVWIVVFGRLRWSIVMPDGQTTCASVATEDAPVWIDPVRFERVLVRFEPEVPCECLRFDAGLLRELAEPAPGPVEVSDSATPRFEAPRIEVASESPGAGSPRDRRGDMRVAVNYGSRIALLGLTSGAFEPVAGRVVDLSESGFRMKFVKAELRHSIAALGNAAITIDLDLPDPDGALQLAGRVRWIDFGEGDDSAHLGVEFVLLTEPDRAAIAATLRRGGPTAASARSAKSIDLPGFDA